MSVIAFPCVRSNTQPLAGVYDTLPLGERFTLTDDVHNPVIECNNCKEPLVFNEHVTVVGMRDAMQQHRCKE
jgi:hypothetical protein